MAHTEVAALPIDPWNSTVDAFKSHDPVMQHCLELAKIAGATNIAILILGESGVGKTMLAHAVHKCSLRKERPFISFNAAALSDTLLDSQLFGHEKGAFTGAQRDVRGKFELADGGTLFIDEIADMSLSAQAKILRAVEYGEYERLGSEKLMVSDVRVISATHLPIHSLIKADKFRRDLFYRLSGVTIKIPPLRERPNDLPYLIASEMLLAGKWHQKSVEGIEKTAMATLRAYPWPGNLRELKTIIHTAVALMPGKVITSEFLLFQDDISLALEESLSADNNIQVSSPNHELLTLADAEQQHIQHILKKANGQKSYAAKLLGISRSTLDRKLAEL